LDRRSTAGRLSTLDAPHDRVGEVHHLAPALRWDDELRAAVAALWAALDVAQRLELVDDPAGDLLVASRASREALSSVVDSLVRRVQDEETTPG
jgi:hypothetical protein